MSKRKPPCKTGQCTHDVPHGSSSTYGNHGCRCTDCRTAWAAFKRRMQAQRMEALFAGRADVEHGKATTYQNWACRCDACTAAATAERRRYRMARTS